MAKDCYLGIRINGVLFKIDTLDFDSDQSDYDYICSVTHVYDRNFNGRYSINITDKNYNDCVING